MRKILWTPPEEYKNSSNMMTFMKMVNRKYNLDLSDYRALINGPFPARRISGAIYGIFWTLNAPGNLTPWSTT